MSLDLLRDFQFPKSLLQTLKHFHENGHEAFLVGGSVRDILLGLPVGDFDITTNATPDQVQELFDHSIPTGIKYGTVTLICDEEDGSRLSVEVTTYRSESGYQDSRRPEDVIYETKIEADLSRRDFTINAFAYNPIDDTFIDQFEGLADLKTKGLVTVRNPSQRFKEDTLRIFRFFRFLGQLGFTPNEEALKAIKKVSHSFPLPAVERILVEMTKLMESPNPHLGLQPLRDLGILERFIPGAASITDDCLLQLQSLDVDLRWASFFLDHPNPKPIMKSLRFSSKNIKWVLSLITHNLDRDKASFKITDLAISGQDIMALGIQGPAIGKAQQFLLEQVRDHGLDNSAAVLLDFLKKERSGLKI